MNAAPTIIIQDLRKKLQDRDVLDGVNLEITHGEARVIVGGSGVGKSVLLKHITGLMVADSGSIIVDGIEVNDVSGNPVNSNNYECVLGAMDQTGNPPNNAINCFSVTCI